MKKKTGADYYTNRHGCFLLQYHIVLVTKYRHPVLSGGVKEAVYETIRYVAESRGFNILELNGEPDHVHLLIEADPQTSPGELEVIKNYIKVQRDKIKGHSSTPMQLCGTLAGLIERKESYCESEIYFIFCSSA